MNPRLLLATALALVLPASLAQAQQPVAQPLAGTGENIQAISHIAIGDGQKNEIDLAGDFAYISWDGGMTIVNIADPAKPSIEGVWDCPGGWGDIDLNPDATLAVLAEAHGGTCEGAGTAATIVDISDKKNPKTVGKIDLDADIEYVHTTTLDNKTLYLNPQVWVGYPQTASHVSVWDISDPSKPAKKGFVEFTGPAAAHDTYIDHRPDGKNLMYSASIHFTDVFDVTNPTASTAMQRIYTPDSTISHQAEPSHDRKLIVLNDESAVDQSGAGAICGRAGGPGAAAVDVGSIHFYEAAADGTFANAGLAPVGSWNIPIDAYPATCTSHVFWQAPNENRLTEAFYTEGAHIIDFSDPANAEGIGSFKAEPSTKYWSTKPHRGYLFATDMERGLDIMRYTGEGGTRWPATAGPAEVQRARIHGVPYVPLAPSAPLPAPAAPARPVGRFSFKGKLSAPRGKGKVSVAIAFTNSAGRKVAGARVKRKAGKRSTFRASGSAIAGSYRWTAKAGRKVVGRGRIKVVARQGMTLSPGTTMTASAR